MHCVFLGAVPPGDEAHLRRCGQAEQRISRDFCPEPGIAQEELQSAQPLEHPAEPDEQAHGGAQGDRFGLTRHPRVNAPGLRWRSRSGLTRSSFGQNTIRSPPVRTHRAAATLIGRTMLRWREVRLAKTALKFVWPKCSSAHAPRAHRTYKRPRPATPTRSHRTYHERSRFSAYCNRIFRSGQGGRVADLRHGRISGEGTLALVPPETPDPAMPLHSKFGGT